MKKDIYLLMLFIFVLSFSSWTFSVRPSIDKLKWLVGTWVYHSSKSTLYETWMMKSDDEMFGKSYMLKDADTLIFEQIRLTLELGKYFYIPTVTNQNNQMPVRFPAKSVSAHEMIFEDLQHDFPQQVKYTLIRKDSLVAVVSGVENGKYREEVFPMNKIEFKK